MLVKLARSLSFTLLISMFAVPFVAACGDSDGGDDESFATFQDCFDDHHGEEGFSVQKAITICCLDHPIGSSAAGVVCGATADTCDDYVDANLADTDATTDDIDAACTDYETQKGM